MLVSPHIPSYGSVSRQPELPTRQVNTDLAYRLRDDGLRQKMVYRLRTGSNLLLGEVG